MNLNRIFLLVNIGLMAINIVCAIKVIYFDCGLGV